MNAYDQLHAIREELERRNAKPETLTLLDRFISQAEPEQDSQLSVTQPMILRHMLRQRDALNNETITMDLLALAGDLDDRRALRSEDDAPNVTVDAERRPQHDKAYYKKLKERQAPS